MNDPSNVTYIENVILLEIFYRIRDHDKKMKQIYGQIFLLCLNLK